MTCQHCGAALPPIAMFCGECGRSVSATSVVPRVAERPEAPVSAHGAPPVPTVSPEPAVSPGASVSPEPEPEPEPELEPEPVRIEPEGVRQPAPTPHPSVVVTRWCSECDSVAEPDDLYCAECGHRLADDTRVIEPIAARAVADVSIAPVLQPTVEPEPEPEPEPAALPFGDALRPMPELDLEATRLVGPHEPVPTFVLQFSTGESYTVVGSGLAGRNPRPEPGEVFDHLVTIVDPGRSVSKTHLEFGQTDGVFWVSDRFSGNGTVIRGDAGEHRACAPGRRYPIARGTRIDLGEQFVIVS